MPNQRSTNPRDCLQCSKGFFPFKWERTKALFCSLACKNANKPNNRIDNFWSKVTKTDTCWIWNGSKTEKGYGRFMENKKHFYAHRFALELTIGRPLVIGEQANHECDNRICVRVGDGHIFLGSQLDNMRDASSKGRCFFQSEHGKLYRSRGESHWRSKLTPHDIRLIRLLRKQGWSQQAIANHVGTPQTNISLILLGKAWAHID